MGKSTIRYHLLAAAVLLLAICIAVSQALALDATLVYVNNYALDGTTGKTFWRNGNVPGTSDNWNAYFDSSTATLWLDGAVINVPYVASFYSHLIMANGDITLKLKGKNEILYSKDGDTFCTGVYSPGDITIANGEADGSGELYVALSSSYSGAFGGTVGIYPYTGSLTIESGAIYILTNDEHNACQGVSCDADLTILGGALNIQSYSSETLAIGALVSGTFTMSGGKIKVVADGETSLGTNSSGLFFYNALITGGEGRIDFKGSSGYSGIWDSPESGTFSVTGGSLIFTNDEGAALYIDTSDQTLLPTTSGSILVSTMSAGDAIKPWNPSMGLLASNLTGTSSFRYVEFLVRPISHTSAPQTGDGQSPLLWLGIGLIMLSGVGALLCVRRKRSA